MSEVVERLSIPCIKLGEGPYWLSEEKCLLMVDVFGKALRKYHVETRTERVLYLDNPEAERASMAIPIQGEEDLYVIGLGKTVSVVRWPKEEVTGARPVTPTIIHTTNDHHLNDAKCDANGRLWFGTMTYLDEDEVPAGNEDSALYRCDQDLQVTRWMDKTSISNGMAWSSDGRLFYFVDTKPGKIYLFDYDLEKGEAANPRVFFDYHEAGLTNQCPDGMCIDTKENLWVACFGGGQVICIEANTRKVIRTVKLPSPNLTSVCFGGPDLATLFVTSGTKNLTEAQKEEHPEAGGTFAVSGLGVKGVMPVKFKCDLGKVVSLMKE